jgi:hypothetical protein
VYKHIFRSVTPPPANLAEAVVEAFWRAFAVTSPAVTSAKKRR